MLLVFKKYTNFVIEIKKYKTQYESPKYDSQHPAHAPCAKERKENQFITKWTSAEAVKVYQGSFYRNVGSFAYILNEIYEKGYIVAFQYCKKKTKYM